MHTIDPADRTTWVDADGHPICIAARPRFDDRGIAVGYTPEEVVAIEMIAARTGCHRCGARDPGWPRGDGRRRWAKVHLPYIPAAEVRKAIRRRRPVPPQVIVPCCSRCSANSRPRVNAAKAAALIVEPAPEPIIVRPARRPGRKQVRKRA